MVRQAADLLEILRLVGRAISGDFTVVMFGGKQRFPQARSADTIEILANYRRSGPHRECLERSKDLDPGSVAHIRKNLQIRTQLRQIDHEGRTVDAGQVEMGEGPGIASSGFHQPNGALNTRNAPSRDQCEPGKLAEARPLVEEEPGNEEERRKRHDLLDSLEFGK